VFDGEVTPPEMFPAVVPDPAVIAEPEIATESEAAVLEPLVPVVPVTSHVRSVSACANETKTRHRRNEQHFIRKPLE
jgi:hypothetical protein